MREFRVYRGIAAPEMRATDAGPVLVGYGSVFNRYSQNLGGFVEQVDPAAFNDTLTRGGNVVGLGNHDPSWLIASTESNTMSLTVDGTGLGYAMNVDLADPDGLRMERKAATGKLKGSSFSFRVLPDGETWSTTDQGFPLRTLRSVDLFDVGPVTFPAYKQTEDDGLAVALRSLADSTNNTIDQLVAAAHDGDLSKFVVDLRAEPRPEVVDAPPEAPEQHSRSVAVRRYAATHRAG